MSKTKSMLVIFEGTAISCPTHLLRYVMVLSRPSWILSEEHLVNL